MAVDYRKLLEHGRDAYNSRDPEAWLDVWSTDCEWHPFLTARVEGDPGYHGHNGMIAWFEDTDEMFIDPHVEVDQIEEVKGRLLVLGQMTATGRGSGAAVSSEVGWVLEPRGELFRRGWSYSSHVDAEREAAALAPVEPRA